jgi:hypothetical protein
MPVADISDHAPDQAVAGNELEADIEKLLDIRLDKGLLCIPKTSFECDAVMESPKLAG